MGPFHGSSGVHVKRKALSPRGMLTPATGKRAAYLETSSLLGTHCQSGARIAWISALNDWTET
ncbi:hypothetical protein HJFPF1_11386 [Paramyrothecium foliicola]|nr:hypothetical protein HJFPF1_11386 [Paramyrothecium foliicola]